MASNMNAETAPEGVGTGVFEGIPMGRREETNDEKDQSFTRRATNKREEGENTYNQLEKIAKMFVVVSGVVYLMTLLVLIAPSRPEEPYVRSTSVVFHDDQRKGDVLYHNPEDDDDVTVWHQNEEYVQDSATREMQESWSAVETYARAITDAGEFASLKEGARDVFVVFNAPWCVWSQRMRQTWHDFAADFAAEAPADLTILEVDCQANAEICREECVMAFPTMRWYRHGEKFGVDYGGDRTVKAFRAFAVATLASDSPLDEFDELRTSKSGEYPEQRNDRELEGEKALPSRVGVALDEGDEEEEDIGEGSQEDEEQPNFQPRPASSEWKFATTVTEQNFEELAERHVNYFINFGTSWCVWCQRLDAPWNQFALVAKHIPLDLAVGEVDCAKEHSLCHQRFEIMSYPTLAWFRNGQWVETYKGDRSLEAILDFSRQKLQNLNALTASKTENNLDFWAPLATDEDNLVAVDNDLDEDDFSTVGSSSDDYFYVHDEVDAKIPIAWPDETAVE